MHGFADCLHAGIFAPSSEAGKDDDDDESQMMQQTATDDPRATLVLQLLLNCADHEAPNLTHFLLGMDVAGGFDGETANFCKFHSEFCALCCCGLLVV